MAQKKWSTADLYWLRGILYKWIMIGFAVFVAGFFLVTGYGRVEEIDKNLPAVVLTGNGEVLSTEVRVTGEFTVYPFGGLFGSGRDTFEADAGEGIFVAGKPVAYDIRFSRDTGEYLYIRKNDQPSYPAQYVVKRGCGEFVFCMDVGRLFPEKGSGLCLVVAPAETVEDAADILEAIPREDLQDDFRNLVLKISE